MFRKLFLNLIILFTGICAHSLYGFNCDMSCCHCPGSGFLIGGYGTFHSFYFHAKDISLNLNFNEQEFWEYDAEQRAPGGGIYIGYGIPLCERFNLAFKAAVTGFASEARHVYYDDNTVNSHINKMRAKYSVDLSLEPGANIGNRLFLYAKFGLSNVGLSQVRQILNEDRPVMVIGKDKQHGHHWGYLFGSGANVVITRCISAFTEYDWSIYSLNLPKMRVDNSDDSNEPLDYRLIRLCGHGFRFGLMAQF